MTIMTIRTMIDENHLSYDRMTIRTIMTIVQIILGLTVTIVMII